LLLIPSIDLRGGRCVRLRAGDFAAETAYAIEPAALAERYRTLGARWLHVVDLDGAKDGIAVNTPIIMELARQPSICLQVGGGVRSAAVIEALLSGGVARVVVGTAAIERPDEVAAWLREFGPERICLAFDVRLSPRGEPRVRTDGWTRNAPMSLDRAIASFARTVLKHVLCTDIERDGTLNGPNVQLYRNSLARFPELRWQASGGIRNVQDLRALKAIGLAAAVAGTALLQERIPATELRPFLPDESSPVSTYAPA
jgi:phosphoribosylformimino-5-aminoimidazole carboxamide ribotide isomerase